MEWIKLGHVFFATIWFGGHVYIEGLLASAGRSGDPHTYATTVAQTGKTSGRLFPIASILTVVFGVWLIVAPDSVWEFSDVFVSIGFLVTIIGIGIGIFYLTPKDKEISELLAEKGPNDPGLIELIGRVKMMNHVMTGLVVIALVVMVIKPGL